MTDKDPKRTGVKAVEMAWDAEGMEFADGRWFAPPGAMVRVANGGIGGFVIACPGCGAMGSARDGQAWRVTGGSVLDVATLSLSPSIKKGCCGWHGYLRGGVFESC